LSDAKDQKIRQLEEQVELLRGRLESVPARERPQFAPAARLAILRMAWLNGWSCKEIARRFVLGQERVGRVAVSVSKLAIVFPVNYSLVSDEILFFTGEGTKLEAAIGNGKVTFEVDHVDPFAETGWSVLVVGSAREVTEPVVVAGARASGLRPWTGSSRATAEGSGPKAVSSRALRSSSRSPASTPRAFSAGTARPRSTSRSSRGRGAIYRPLRTPPVTST